MTHHLYIFSGLGTDERVFQLLDFSGFPTTFIKWLVPFESESIEHYASRLLAPIKTIRPTFIGLSFGGLIAVELARQIEVEKIILIASAKTKNEIPFYYRWAGKAGLHKLLPTQLLRKSALISNWFFGATSIFEKQLLKTILADTDPTFFNWAIDKAINCKMKLTSKT